MNSLVKNVSYQTLYRVLTLITPFITAPYLARVLGVENLGVFSFYTAIMDYFLIFAQFGFANYGTKVIAYHQDDRKAYSKTFWSLYVLQVIITVIVINAYGVYILMSIGADSFNIVLIQLLMLISCLFDINWFFWGIEEFKITVVRNIIIKILTVSSIILFVKDSSDLNVYVFIMAFGTFLTQISIWPYLKRYISKAKIDWREVKTHFLGCFKLFIPILAMSVYQIMDKVMLGWISGFTESGFYYNSDKVVAIPLELIFAVVTAILPRISYLVNLHDDEKATALFRQVFNILIILTCGMAFGIAAISNEFVPLFFGDGYERCINLIKMFAPIVVIKSGSYVLRMLYLIPYEMDGVYLKSVLWGIVANLIGNSIFIYPFGAAGAIIGTTLAELSVFIYQIMYVKKNICMNKSLSVFFVSVIAGSLMYISVRYCSMFEINRIVVIMMEILAGVIVYLGVSCLLFLPKISKSRFLKR